MAEEEYRLKMERERIEKERKEREEKERLRRLKENEEKNLQERSNFNDRSVNKSRRDKVNLVNISLLIIHHLITSLLRLKKL
jgi:hypothetical protein